VLLLKGDIVLLWDKQVVEVAEVWGFARCHARVLCDRGSTILIIAERDVERLIRRPALRGRR
jgi:hypothetical protein